MITKETVEYEIGKFIAQHTLIVTTKVKIDRGLQEPLCTFLFYNFKTSRFSTMSLPIGMGFHNDETKNALFKHALPNIFKMFDDDFKQIICLSLCSEAWMRKASVEDLPPRDKDGSMRPPDNWKDIPKYEALCIHFETADYAIMRSFEMKRTNGKLTGLNESITIDSRKEGQQTEGRFADIFRKYNRIKSN